MPSKSGEMLNNEMAVVNRFETHRNGEWVKIPLLLNNVGQRSGTDDQVKITLLPFIHLVCSPWHQTQPFLSLSDLYNRLSTSSAEDIENLVYKYLREDVDYPKHMLFTLASKIAQYITYKVI